MTSSEKTIFILDHSPSMSRKVQVPINLTSCIGKGKGNIELPEIKVAQTLWSCAVEAVSEYCRIVWDIFGLERSILFYIGDHNRTPKNINSWDKQGMDYFMKAFAGIGAPANGATELTFQTQLKCLEMALWKLTESQPHGENNASSSTGEKATSNKGRIVFIGSMVNDLWENNSGQTNVNSQKEISHFLSF